MRTIITVDDELYQRALALADPGMDRSDLFREAIKVFVRVQAAKRLSALGGSSQKNEKYSTSAAGIRRWGSWRPYSPTLRCGLRIFARPMGCCSHCNPSWQPLRKPSD